jgi:8-oxo-dGTP pyrophosphatase MutT (NUDIX family)
MKQDKPTLAATVILVRHAERGGFEVFLTRRPNEMPFLGGLYCFPGGTVRKDDCSAGMLQRCYGLAPGVAREIVGAHFTPQAALGLWVAGIRELLEEVGILLAVNETGRSWTPERVEKSPASQHASLHETTSSFQSLLESKGLFCDASKLFYFSHWQTPAPSSLPFDSRFFLAALPEDQEVVHGLWLTPDQALKRFGKDELPMIFPTFASLRTLADFESLENLLTEYGSKTWRSINSERH